LARRGYDEGAIVIGENAEEAEDIFFHNWRGAIAAAPPPPPPPPPPPVAASEEPRV
jgi:phosphatidylserine/phosphatidylglycerophosphate/cardiolipin synthase-like enzyme